jgi:hypothetical protein
MILRQSFFLYDLNCKGKFLSNATVYTDHRLRQHHSVFGDRYCEGDRTCDRVLAHVMGQNANAPVRLTEGGIVRMMSNNEVGGGAHANPDLDSIHRWTRSTL